MGVREEQNPLRNQYVIAKDAPLTPAPLPPEYREGEGS
jgi:hypothetical protein